MPRVEQIGNSPMTPHRKDFASQQGQQMIEQKTKTKMVSVIMYAGIQH